MDPNHEAGSSPIRPVEDVNHSSVREEVVLHWWREHDIFAQTMELRKDAPDYVFYEGPPTANGLPGVHHVQSRTFKDLICRLKTMEGYRVLRKGGWDTHGLPVEIEVEKELGFEHKAEIEAYGIAPFNKRCRESVLAYEEDWRTLTERIAFWLDLNDPYYTFSNEYIESVWWILSRFFQKDLIYRGRRILPYCPRCGTPLSSHEVSLGFRDADDPSVYVRFPVLDPGPANEVLGDVPEGMARSLLVWTTTPWTFISNTFAVVHADLEYAEIELDVPRLQVHKSLDTLYGKDYHKEVFAASAATDGRERLILARNRALALFGDPDSPGSYRDDVDEIATFKGAQLAGFRYQRPFEFVPFDHPDTHQVFVDDYVTDEDGTGIVHCSPAYGEDDYNTGQREAMPIVEPVNEEGCFSEEVTPWAGVFVKEADRGIILDLAERGLLLRTEAASHTYPFCWRCDTPLLYMARPSWYVRTTQIKDRLLSANRSINWVPSEVGTGRMGEWLENNQDWALSRDRYWGTPLPIWVCDHIECDEMACMGSVDDLRAHAEQEIPHDLDLHKPYVDEFTWACECGRGTMHRTPEVIDVWFDSGSMPYAQWHYPFENRELFERQFPADYISEGIDQTRGWFYSLLAIAAFLFDQPAYRNVLVTEMMLDRNGQKMSKSKGNAVDPWDVIERWGADPLRWYIITNSPPWSPTRFDEEGVAEASRKFFGTLHNTHAFFALYAAVDGFDPDLAEWIPPEERTLFDRWILSRLNGMARTVRRHLGRFEVTRAARAIHDFVVEDLSNWYVRRSRRRFWKGEPGPDKTAAYFTLHEILVTVAGLLAPFVPFTSEELWRNLQAWRQGAADSVHLTDYPAGDSALVDEELDRTMSFVRELVALGRAARNRVGLKVRQPLSVMTVVAGEAWQVEAIERFEDLIREEMNVKSVDTTASSETFTGLAAEPVFSRLGPRFGGDVNQAADVLRGLADENLLRLREGERVSVEVGGRTFEFEPDDARIDESEPEGLAVEREGTMIIAISTALDKALVQEGLAREFTIRIQALRRQIDYAVTDRIRIGYEASEELSEALEAHSDYVAEETLAVDITAGLFEKADRREEWELDGELVTVAIARA
jgi:isoleucyl-tRNA synthetase